MSLSIYDVQTNIEKMSCKISDPPDLLSHADNKRNKGLYNDVKISSGEGESIPANRLVLSCFSGYFKNMFETEMIEKYKDVVEIEGVDRDSMKTLIDFIYTGNININNENVCKLLAASDYLQIETAKQFCFNFLEAATTSDNCLAILSVANCYKSDSLNNHVKQFININFTEVACSDQFKSRPKNEIISCISNLDRNIVQETFIYNAVVKWTKQNEENRINDFPLLLKLIQFHKLPQEFLNDVVVSENLLLKNQISSEFWVKEIRDGLKAINKKEEQTKIWSLDGINTQKDMIEIYNVSRQIESETVIHHLPSNRYAGCAVNLNEFIYFVGEFDSKNQTTNTVWKMNVNKQMLQYNILTWNRIASMSEARCDMAAEIFNDKLVVVGGFIVSVTRSFGFRNITNNNALSSGEYYCADTKKWEDVASMKEPRCKLALVSCKGFLYAIGGIGGIGGIGASGTNGKSSVERLSSLDEEWENVSSMTTSRMGLAAVNCDEFIYAIGGQRNDKNNTILNSAEKYDPSTDSWTDIASMNYARSGCSACVLRGRIFVAGGKDSSGNAVTPMECYDPLINKWTVVKTLNYDLQQHSLVVM